LNYRHDFHAGNFADVFKHILLTRVLIHLAQKPKPYRVIDTHAGSGLYDLTDERAEKTGEWRSGIARLLATDVAADFGDETAALLEPYLAIVTPLIEGNPPLYPGSPFIALRLMRPDDKLQCCELEPSAAERLKANCGKDKRFRLAELDAYVGLRAFIPPAERRGLVLIDPPFERPDEFEALGPAVFEAWRKWTTGIFFIWYPVKDPRRVDRFFAGLCEKGVKRLLRLELQVAPSIPDGPLVRTGLAIINPPFGFDAQAERLLPALASPLSNRQSGSYVVEWKSGE